MSDREEHQYSLAAAKKALMAVTEGLLDHRDVDNVTDWWPSSFTGEQSLDFEVNGYQYRLTIQQV